MKLSRSTGYVLPLSRDPYLTAQIYHSIHAKGENVEDVLSVAENDDGELDQNEYMDAGEPVESAADESKQAVCATGLVMFIY